MLVEKSNHAALIFYFLDKAISIYRRYDHATKLTILLDNAGPH